MTLLLHLAKNLCDKGYKTVYIDAEGSVKDDLINGVGLSPYVCTSDNKDNKFLVIRESGYKAVETVIKKCLSTGEFKLFILDSLTALSPDIYLDEDSDRVGTEDRVGYEAQLNGRLLKQLNSLKYKYILYILHHTVGENRCQLQWLCILKCHSEDDLQ